MLRKIFSRMVVSVGLTATVGCLGTIDGNEQLGSNGPRISWEEFRDSTYREPAPDGLFIVDGDTPIDGEKNLREFYDALFPPDGALIVHTVGGSDAAWSATQKLNLTYCISNTFGTTNKAKVVSAMANATANWQAVANVKYIYKSDQDANCTASNTNVVFDIRPTSGAGYLARAFFPNNGRSSRNVIIDSSSFGNLSPWTLTGILTHELGHTLGFRHEHTRPEAGTCFEDNSWRPLTPYDGSSVMHYPQCNGSQNGDLVITSKDAQGAAALYGEPGGDPDPDPDPDPTQTKTDSGSVAKNVSVQLGGVSVKPGSVFKAVMTGSGDPDLYVRFGAQPTTSSYNCRPYLDGPNETCELTVPANATTAYVMVRGYTAATYSVTRTWTAP